MKTLLAFLLLSVAPALALEDPPRRGAPPAHVETDREVEAAIIKGIVANPEVFAAQLRVAARNGAVTLHGSVKNKDARATAEKITRAVPGVRSVTNRLTIRAPER